MSNRLISKFTKCKKGSLGYTLTEMLVTIGIIVVLLAIAIPALGAVSKALKFKQRNDYAKSIFLAAQANLTEMRSDGGLSPLQGTAEEINSIPIPSGHSGFPAEEWSDEYVYTASQLSVAAGQRDSYAMVLPVGSVDGTLRNQQVIIEYNPLTGNVYSVFYCEEASVNILAMYNEGTLPRNADGDKALRKELMIGYYDGSGLSSSELELERSEAQVVYSNDEEGLLTVRIPMPRSYYGKHQAFIESLEVILTISGEENGGNFEVYIKESANNLNNPRPANTQLLPSTCVLDTDGATVLITCKLDSLVQYGSFANLSTGTYKSYDADATTFAEGTHLTEMSTGTLEGKILPGDNISVQADVNFYKGGSNPHVTIRPGIISGINPMFEYLEISPSDPDKYILAVANGRNLQNLNAIHPTIAAKVESVVFTSDIYWNRTTHYYSELYGHSYVDANTDGCCDICNLTVAVHGAGDCYASSALEAPARALPYFVPIHNANLFGTARFGYPNANDSIWNTIFDIIGGLIGGNISSNNKVPTLTDEVDQAKHATISGYNLDNSAHGNVAKVYYLNINANKYPIGTADINRISSFYATGANHVVAQDYYDFTGLFAYVNTTIDNLEVVNPIVKGKAMTESNNPCTGALYGAGGYNTQITNCGVYIDTTDSGFSRAYLSQGAYTPDGDQTWYGVSGEGAVGGLVGYSKSHRTVNGELTNDKKHLAFANSFAAVNVTGNMRKSTKNPNGYLYGYSNGVGGFIGNSQLTNFYNCYSSGHVIATDYRVVSIYGDDWTSYLNLYHSGKESYGAGGFVGTSHGTRYTNCFATGDVTASGVNSAKGSGGGGFVGVMSYDEDITYGHDTATEVSVSQHTVFTNCYAVGLCNANAAAQYRENFSGANARIKVSMAGLSAYYTGDYYKILAPYYLMEGHAPYYQTRYIFKDSYYLSQYGKDASQDNSNKCSTATDYDTLASLHTLYNNEQWIQSQINNLKNQGLDATFFEVFVKSIFSGNWREILDMLFGDKVFGMYFDLYDDYRRNGGLYMNDIYKNAYTQGFQATEWESATTATTHSYALNAAGSIYPFSKLVGMDYYGDWPGKPLTAGLAYYEVYEDGSTGYYFDRDLTSTLRHEDVIVSDGYAILCGSKDTNISVSINDGTPFTITSSEYNITLGSIDRPGSNTYYYAVIPAEKLLIASDSDFYTKIQVTIRGTTYVMYYNPNVALTQVNPTNGNYATKPDAAPNQIYVRTARQFAALGTMEKFWGENYNYVQQLDIDANEYQWQNCQLKNNKLVLQPIGTEDSPFNGTYTGNGGYVTKATLAGFVPGTAEDDSVTGLFGVIGETGKITALNVSLIQENNAAVQVETEAVNLGVLAGVSNGTLDNVSVKLDAQLTLKTDAEESSAGLLVGLASGTISNCDITGNKSATIHAENVGLVLGSAENVTINKCTVSPNGDFISKGSNVGGFAGVLTNATVTNVNVTTKILRTEADQAGGFAGKIEGGSITTATVKLNAETKNEKTPAEEEKAYLAGFAGLVDQDALIANVSADVSVLVSGDCVSGLFGKVGTGTIRNTTLNLTGGILNASSGASGAVIDADVNSLFENMTLTLASGQIKASSGNAAGFAVDLRGQVLGIQVLLGENEQKTMIKGAEQAAGFACEISGQINSVYVRGIGEINSSAKAAGFAVTVSGANGRVAASGVSTVVNDTAAGYLGESNDNLLITAPEAAGFLLNLNTANNNTTTAGIYNCFTLGKIVGANAYGFAGTVEGIIDGCTSNATFADVQTNVCRAFVGTNNGAISNCYGWYGDGEYAGYEYIEAVPTATNEETGEITLTDKGNYFSCYFVDTDMRTDEDNTVTLIDISGKVEKMTPDELGNSAMQKLNGSGTNSTYRWHITGAYEAYPYSTFERPTYQYPMLRVHRGDWVTAPRYAYGIGYYEKQELNGETVWNLRIVDLSFFDYNVEDRIMNVEGVFDSEGQIVEGAELFAKDAVITDAGYVVFVKTNKNGTYASPFTMNGETNVDIVGEPFADIPAALLDANANYAFYRLNAQGAMTISSGDYPEASTNLITYFANTIGVGEGPYAVRTIGQLADIGKVAGVSLYQDHESIACTAFPLVNEFTGIYDGCGYEISITDPSTVWMNTLSGTVKNLNLTVTGDSKAMFGIVSGQVEDLMLNITGNLVEEPFKVVQGGSVDVKSVKANLLSDNLFGIVQLGGSVGLESLEVQQIDASIVGTLADSAVTQLHVNLPSQTLRVPLIETAATTEGATAIEGAVTSISDVVVTMAGAELAQGGLIVPQGNKVDMSNITITVPQITFTGDGDEETQDNFGVLAGTLTGGTVTNVTVNTTKLTAPWGVVGGLVGNNDADVTDVIVKDMTIQVTGQKNKESIIGGLAGINSGDIGLTAEGKTNVDADILYVQPILDEEDDSAIIGGLVGRMDSGVMGVENLLMEASGSIQLTNQEILVWEDWKARKEADPELEEAEPTFTPADSARSYIIGGAVGRNDGASCIAVYTEVEVDADWKNSLFVNGDVAEGIKEITSFDLNGPVGQFVGYVASGSSFDHCYGAGAADSLHFMGEIQYVGEQYLGENTYGGFAEPFAADYIFNPETAEEFAAFKEQYDVSNTYIAGYDAELNECYYTKDGKIYKQEFTDTQYYYTGTDNIYDSYTTQLINDPLTFTGNANLTVTSFGNATTQTLTNWYYEQGGNYYRVWYQYSKVTFLWYTGHGVQLWIDSNLDGQLESIVNIAAALDGDIFTPKDRKIDKTLYTASDISIGDGMYMIVTGNKKVLASDGSVVGFQDAFTTEGGANQALVSAIWNNTSGKWSSNGQYLNLADSVIGAEKDIQVTLARGGKDNLVFSLKGGKYLNYDLNTETFSIGDRHKGLIHLYRVFVDHIYKMSFSNQLSTESLVSTEQEEMILPGAGTEAAVENIEEDTEITESTESAEPTVSTESTEGTEPPVDSGEDQVESTEPPATEDGDDL